MSSPDTPLPPPHDVTDEPGTVYRLVRDTPAGSPDSGNGWTLVGELTEGWCWTIALSARGASADAGPRIAKAVAVRVLAQQGVTVDAWADDEHAETHQTGRTAEGPANGRLAFRAVLRPASGAVPEPRGATTLTRTLLWRLRGH